LNGCKDCANLGKQLAELKQENAYLKFELQQLKDSIYRKKLGKKPSPPQEKPTPKKKGGLFGHKGWWRRKPKTIEEIEDVKLDRCPECGSSDITECSQTEEHIQEDIILPKVITTLFKKHRYYCKNCKRTVTAASKQELSKSYIGSTAKALACFLKYSVKISDRDIKNIFGKMFNLKDSHLEHSRF